MSIKATRRTMISCYAQIVLGHKIPELVKHEKIKARKLSYDSQVYLLMLGQFLHVFSLNELVDISKIYAKELSRIRGISPANLNTFSNANRTRNPSVMEKFFCISKGPTPDVPHLSLLFTLHIASAERSVRKSG